MTAEHFGKETSKLDDRIREVPGSAVGVRDVVENKVDFTHTRGVIIAVLILVPAVGVNCAGSIRLGHAKNTPDFRPRCFF